MHLDELDFASLAHEGALDLLLAAELVRDGARAIGEDVQHVFDGAGMSPCQQGIDAVHLGIKLVVLRGADLDQGEAVA